MVCPFRRSPCLRHHRALSPPSQNRGGLLEAHDGRLVRDAAVLAQADQLLAQLEGVLAAREARRGPIVSLGMDFWRRELAYEKNAMMAAVSSEKAHRSLI
jgi:hypothetical protein